MKGFLVTCLCFVAVTFSSFAEDNDLQVGVGLGYGTEVEEIGVSAQGALGLSERLSVAADVRIFFMPDPTSFWAFNANVHYLLLEGNSLDVFVLGGLNYATMSIDFDFGDFGSGSSSSSEIGLNIGAGANLEIGEMTLRPELKYVLSEFDQLVASATLLFNL